MLIYGMFLAYVIFRGVIMVMKTETSTVTNSYVEKMNYTNPATIDYDQDGFDFAFSLMPEMPPSYGVFVVEHLAMYTNPENQERTFVATSLDFDYCGLDGIQYDDKDEIMAKGFDRFFCIQNKTPNTTTLGGAFFSLVFQ